MITLEIAGAAAIMLALAYGAWHLALWQGHESHRRTIPHLPGRPGYELSGYENGRRVMELWPAIMAQASTHAPTDDTPPGPVTCHAGYCGAWGDES